MRRKISARSRRHTKPAETETETEPGCGAAAYHSTRFNTPLHTAVSDTICDLRVQQPKQVIEIQSSEPSHRHSKEHTLNTTRI